MIKSQAATLVMALGALATTGVAVTASQLVSSASPPTTPKATKSAEATPPPKSLSVSGSLNVQGLAPGVVLGRTVTIGNDNNQDVELQSVRTVITGPSPGTTTGACSSPADFEVVVGGYNTSTGVGTPVTIRKRSSLGLPVTVRMNNRPVNQDTCKGKSWTFTFTATATSK